MENIHAYEVESIHNQKDRHPGVPTIYNEMEGKGVTYTNTQGAVNSSQCPLSKPQQQAIVRRQ